MARGEQTAKAAGRRTGSRRISTGALITVAIVVSALLMAGLSAQAIAAHASCQNNPLLLNVAVSNDLATAVGRVAQDFNRQDHSALGRCVQVQVSPDAAATVAGRIDGQAPGKSTTSIDAWIPDSSLWFDVVRSFPQGAGAVHTTGIEVAKSPLLIVTPQQVAQRTRIFAAPVGWNMLLPASDGGPPPSMGLHVDLPDPTTSSAGLATLVELSRMLGHGGAARTAFTRFALSAEATSQFGDPASLASFAATAAPPFNGRPVTVTTEQAVIGYDRANSAQPLAAQYPTGFGADLGTPALDYPYLRTTSDPQTAEAARQFGRALTEPYAAQLVRYAGFRSADGAADATPASFGLSSQVLQHAAIPSPIEAQTTLQVWGKLGLGSRDLVLIDSSAAMATPVPPSGLTVEQVLTKTAVLGLSLFPDSTQMGEWQIASRLDGDKPYQQLLDVGPLPADLGLITRRQELQHIDETLRPVQRPLALYDSILAAYKKMLRSYQPNYSNAVIVLTAGVDDPRVDHTSADELVAKLRKLFNPSRKVEVVILMLGTAGDFPAMQRITSVTGGAAFDITSPEQVGKVFIQGFSHRLCDPRCAAP